MKSIRSFFRLAFASKDISDLNLLCFTEDHLDRLKKENSKGLYSEIIEETSMLYHDFMEAYTQRKTLNTRKKEETVYVGKLLENIKISVRQLENYLCSQNLKKTDRYLQLFPKGLTEFSLLNKSNIEDLLSRVLVFLKNNEDISETEIAEEIKTLYTTYRTKRKSQLEKKKVHLNNMKNNKQLKYDLAVRLQLNIYTLAAMFPGNIQVYKTFFDEKLLRVKRQSHNTKKRVNDLVSAEV